MRRFFALALTAIMLVSYNVSAEPKREERAEATASTTSKKQTIKKGWNFAPFPSVGYNSDTGFQIGALCEIFDYGDGSTYPAYKHKFNFDMRRKLRGNAVIAALISALILGGIVYRGIMNDGDAQCG